jgi:hypothetical protein
VISIWRKNQGNAFIPDGGLEGVDGACKKAYKIFIDNQFVMEVA